MSPRYVFALCVGMSFTCGSCTDRAAVNANCQWAEHSAFAVDVSNPIQRQHLVADAQLAEELAIRYADAEHRRFAGYGGHGGLVDNGRLRQQCMTQLVAAIQANHNVSTDAVQFARTQRSRAFDLAVGLSFVCLYVMATAWIARRVFARMSPMPHAAATLLSAVAASLLGVQLAQVWVALWELVRLGNDHVSGFRASHSPWSDHLAWQFIGGVVVFALVSISRDRRAPP